MLVRIWGKKFWDSKFENIKWFKVLNWNFFQDLSYLTKTVYLIFFRNAGLSNRPVGPPHRKTSLPNHKEVKKRFLEICDQTLSEEVKAALRLPTFDSYEWSDENVLHLMQTMFIDCGFVDKFNIPLPVLREWLYEVYKHYNIVPFHNFRHCFCVAQMVKWIVLDTSRNVISNAFSIRRCTRWHGTQIWLPAWAIWKYWCFSYHAFVTISIIPAIITFTRLTHALNWR